MIPPASRTVGRCSTLPHNNTMGRDFERTSAAALLRVPESNCVSLGVGNPTASEAEFPTELENQRRQAKTRCRIPDRILKRHIASDKLRKGWLMPLRDSPLLAISRLNKRVQRRFESCRNTAQKVM